MFKRLICLCLLLILVSSLGTAGTGAVFASARLQQTSLGNPNPYSPNGKHRIEFITQPQQSLQISQGQSAAIYVKIRASHGAVVSLQWFQIIGGQQQPINGATSNPFVLPSDLAVGNHTFLCVASAQDGTTASSQTTVVSVLPADSADAQAIGSPYEYLRPSLPGMEVSNWGFLRSGYVVADMEGGGFSLLIPRLDDYFIIEKYSSDLQLIETRMLHTELNSIAAYHQGSDGYNYILTYPLGTTEHINDKTLEDMRLTRYDSDWQRICSLSITSHAISYITSYGLGPWKAAMADDGKQLILYGGGWTDTSHQANHVISLDLDSLSIQDLRFSGSTHVSHSFAHFAFFTEDSLALVSQGDGYPRAAELQIAERNPAAGQARRLQRIELLRFTGRTGDNYTGAMTGGAAASSNNYLVVGHSVDQSRYSESFSRNVFISVVPKTNPQQARLTWLTELPQSHSSETPYLIPLLNDRFMVIWEEYTTHKPAFPMLYQSNEISIELEDLERWPVVYDDTKYLIIDGNGNPQGTPVSINGIRLAKGIEPIYLDGNLIWFSVKYHEQSEMIYELYCLPLDGGELITVDSRIWQQAQASAETITLTINSLHVTRNGEVLPSPPLPPQLIGARTMLPFRYLVQTILGGEVEYEDETRRITASVNGTEIIMTVDQMQIYVNGVAFEYGQAPVVINGSTLVPLRAFEHVVTEIKWNEDTQTVTIVP